MVTRGPESLWGYPDLRLSLWVGSWHGTGLPSQHWLEGAAAPRQAHIGEGFDGAVPDRPVRTVSSILSRKQQSQIVGRSEGNYPGIQRIFHRTCAVGVAHRSFVNVVVLAGALPTEDERRNDAWRGAWSFPDQTRSYRCLSGNCPPMRAD